MSARFVDAGYVLVIPIGGVIFYAAGRHPLAGIAAAFAGVSGGYSANFVLGTIDDDDPTGNRPVGTGGEGAAGGGGSGDDGEAECRRDDPRPITQISCQASHGR